jgi:large subunit ribosomal protein L21
MFAVIKTGGKQYKVAATDLIRIEKLPGEAGDSIAFGDVLMVGNDDGVTIGSPAVDGATVAGEIVRQTRGDRLIVFKKRRRQNSKRRNGHRQDLTEVRITEILTEGAKPAKAKAAKPKAPAKETAPATEAAPAAEAAQDDMKKISGVGPALEKKLHGLGITTFAQIAAWTEEDIARVDGELNFKGRIERDGWLEQVKTFIADKS